MDSITLTLSNPLPSGTFSIIAKIGSDGNTILDFCKTPVPVNDSVSFSFVPNSPATLDSLTPVGCSPKTIQLVFQKNIQCGSIAPDGSDFVITGTNPIAVINAEGNCNSDGLTNIINITLSSPIQLAGNYQIELVRGTDGNTIIDECNVETPVGEIINFNTADTVSATFISEIELGCKQDTVILSNKGNNGINYWQWIFDDSVTYSTQNVTRIYGDSNYGRKSVMLIVSNGVCTDSSSFVFVLDNQLKSQFSSPLTLCPGDAAVFEDSSTGNITSWNWNFGDGNVSNIENPPPQVYPISVRDISYAVSLTVQNDALCFDTSYHELKVLYRCLIVVPSAFTPNGDGINDYLYPLNADKAINLEFIVYNRWGQRVFESRDGYHKWDGNINGVPQPTGTYVWFLNYTDNATGKKYSLKGTTVLIR